MNAQNLFKDVQMVQLTDNNPTITNNNDESCVVFIDDDILSSNSEDEAHPMDVKIESDLNYDDESNQSMVVEPDDNVIVEVSIKEEIDKIVPEDEDICFKLETPSDIIDLIQENGDHHVEEQFQLIDKANEEIPPSSLEQSFKSATSTLNDHSYSQANPKMRTTFCDDIVETILSQSDLSKNPNALELLSIYTNYLEVITSSEDPNSQVNQYVQKMKVSLDNRAMTVSPQPSTSGFNRIRPALKIDPNIIKINSDGGTTEELLKINQLEEGTNENILEQQNSIELFNSDWDEEAINGEIKKLLDNNQELNESSEELDVTMNCVKEEPELIIEYSQEIIGENNDEEDKVKSEDVKSQNDAEKLKTYIQDASNLGIVFTHSFRDLSGLKYENEEDINNGKIKLLSSLKSVIKQSCILMMEIEEVKETGDIKMEDFIENAMLNISKSYISENKEEKIEEEEEEEMELGNESETDDDEINKLCNINNLKIVNTKSDRTIEKPGNDVAKKLKIKKDKKLKAFSDESDIISSEDDAENDNKRSSDSNAGNSSDEEKKMVEKHENNCKNLLLVSTDEEDESDESTYATSESSFTSSNDGIKKKKKNKQKDRKKKTESEKSENDESDEEKEEKPSKVPLPSPPAKDDIDKEAKESESENESASNENKSKKLKKRPIYGASHDIFKKDFLDMDDSDNEDKEKPVRSHVKSLNSSMEKTNSQKSLTGSTGDKNEPQSEAIDLTQFTARQSDVKTNNLSKYIQKMNEKTTTTELPGKPSTPADDYECYIISSDSDSEISSTVAEGKTRRRKELSPEELKEETKKAQKAEKERIKKLEKKKDVLSQYLTQRLTQLTDEDDVICSNDLTLDHSKKLNLTINVHPKLVDQLKEHQKDGVRFMYDNCYGSLDDVKENNGSGCILAHCMGLGKTLQLITLIHTVIRYPQLCTKQILVICPKSTIFNWRDEFQRWLGGISESRRLKAWYLQDNLKIDEKIKKLSEWYNSDKPGVFLINYEAFRILVNWSGSHQRAKKTITDDLVKEYQAKIQKYLLQPGPHLVVCDEGHLIKNQKGATNQAITKISTRRRIILTGTPIQNNLGEYYAMVHWIKPCYLGDIKEFNNLYANPIKEGQHKDSTSSEIKKMKQKCFVLNKMLDKFVQRREASVLRDFLPEKYEYCLSVPMTEVQTRLYKEFLLKNPFESSGKQLLPHYTALRKVWTHPQVLQYAYERALRGGNKFNSAEQQQKNKTKSKNFISEDEDENPDDVHDTSQGITAVTSNWWAKIASEQELKSLYSSHKLLILFEILKQAQLIGEKVLVFSAFVAVLDVIENFMKLIHNKDPTSMVYGYDQYQTTWEFGKDYYKLDGSTPRDVRYDMIQNFNKEGNSRLRCFLISAKAGGQGINLIGANRCVLIDTSWNPASDQQNIFRIFRLGQQKPCFVYRLVALGTMEEKIYSRSVTKQAMSGRVVDRQTIDRHYRGGELSDLYQFTEYSVNQRETPIMPHDNVLKYLLKNYDTQIFKYHEHDSLLENKPEQDLNEDEKQEAWDSYENEQRMIANRMSGANPMMMNNMYAQLAADQVNMANYGNDMLSMQMNLNNMYSQYGAMPSPYANVNMLPGSSAAAAAVGMDLNSALSKSYYPSLSSTLYGNELFKKLQQAYSDPISSLYAQSPSSQSTTSPSLTTPNSTSLMSSLLRSPLAPPPPLAAHSLPTLANNYNANTIPLSSTSIFANKPPTSASISSSLSALTGGSLQSTSGSTTKSPVLYQQQPFPSKMSLLNKNQKGSVKRIGPLNIAANRKNNSSNLSILPDNEIRTPINNRNGGSFQQLNLAKSKRPLPSFASVQPIATTPSTSSSSTSLSSARTNAPYQRKAPPPQQQQQQQLQQQQQQQKSALKKTSSAISSPNTLTKQVRGLVQPLNRNSGVAIPNKQISFSSNMAEKISNIVKNSNLTLGGTSKQVLNLPKTTTITKSATKSGAVKKPTSADAIPQIQKQLEKNQTSMTDAASSKSTPLQIASVIGGPENSVSIIKLPQLTTASTLTSTVIHRPPPANTTNSSMAITPRLLPNPVRKVVQNSNSAPKFTLVNRLPNASTTTSNNNKIVISPQHLNQSPQFRQQVQNYKRPANPQFAPQSAKKLKLDQIPTPIRTASQGALNNRANIQQQRNNLKNCKLS